MTITTQRTENRIPRIVITPGEPAGIGPDIVIEIAAQMWPAELIVIADPTLLLTRAKQLGIPLTLSPADLTKPPTAHHINQLQIIPVALQAPCHPGKLNTANAGYVIECLKLATDYCLDRTADALVTGPVQKSILNDAQIAFSGHTEFLAARCHAQEVVMLFVVGQLKVALTTTHIPLAEVSQAITKDKLLSVLRLMHRELCEKFNLTHPKILVCGLNPHAGENGHLGREEIEIITPALTQLRAEHIDVIGPLPADTVFTETQLATADAVLAMYHDQALPVVKYIGFNHAVNVTLGLPIIRTSVDHGTALDIAGSKKADAGSLTSAIQLAIQLATKAMA